MGDDAIRRTRGRAPEVVIVAFAFLNAAAIALLVATVARCWGLVYAAALGTFLVVGPDAFLSAWVWHPSFYTAAMALLLAAGIRLRTGSVWWAALLAAVPGLYALIHYSGFVLFAPALALLLLSHRAWSSLLLPVASAVSLIAFAWVPFISFEIGRHWVELRTVVDAADNSSTLDEKLSDRLSALGFAISHLGQSLHGSVHLTRLILVLVVLSFLIAGARRVWRDRGFALPAAVLASGLAAQVVLHQGERADVLMLWLVPLYALAAWAVVQTVELTRLAFHTRAGAPTVAVVAVVFVATIGSIDLANSVRSTPYDVRLSDEWHDARTRAPVRYDAGVDPAQSENRFYLACDPPYDWESEIWYLEDVLHPGSGRRAALEGGAFRGRPLPSCPQA